LVSYRDAWFGACSAGWVLGLLCLAFTAFLSNIAKDYMIEVMARAEHVINPQG
jgi:hypothetical protein